MTVHPLGLRLGFVLAFFTGCPSEPNTPTSYGSCSPGDACPSGTSCIATNITGAGIGGDFCTSGCDVSSGSVCLGGNAVCVILPGAFTGVCHMQCTPDCPSGQTCSLDPSDSTLQVCVPVTSTDAGNMLPGASAYEPCTSAGSNCSDGTTCELSPVAGASGTAGLICTTACTTATTCPGYGPGLVACVPAASGTGSVCMTTCMVESDCSAYGTHCDTLVSGGTSMLLCAP